MRALRDNENFLTLMLQDSETGKKTRLPNAPRYREFWGALGWPDMEKQAQYAMTWFAAIGEQETGEYEIVGEHAGDLAAVAKAAIAWKDMLLIRRIFLDGEDKESVRFLRDPDHCDGLTFYQIEGYEAEPETPIYRHEGLFWPTFRDDYPYEIYAALVPVRDDIRVNVRAGLDRVIALGNAGKLKVSPGCTETQAILRAKPPLKQIVDHPLTKALVYGIGMLELGKASGTTQETARSWYGNLDRST